MKRRTVPTFQFTCENVHQNKQQSKQVNYLRGRKTVKNFGKWIKRCLSEIRFMAKSALCRERSISSLSFFSKKNEKTKKLVGWLSCLRSPTFRHAFDHYVIRVLPDIPASFLIIVNIYVIGASFFHIGCALLSQVSRI